MLTPQHNLHHPPVYSNHLQPVDYFAGQKPYTPVRSYKHTGISSFDTGITDSHFHSTSRTRHPYSPSSSGRFSKEIVQPEASRYYHRQLFFKTTGSTSASVPTLASLQASNQYSFYATNSSLQNKQNDLLSLNRHGIELTVKDQKKNSAQSEVLAILDTMIQRKTENCERLETALRDKHQKYLQRVNTLKQEFTNLKGQYRAKEQALDKIQGYIIEFQNMAKKPFTSPGNLVGM